MSPRRGARLLVAVTLLVGPLAGLGIVYSGAAALLGAGFVIEAIRLYRKPTTARAIRLFRYSIAYLFGLFLVMLVDAVLRLRGA